MRPHNRFLALSLAGLVSATGCATAHMRGEYAPQSLPRGGEVTNSSELNTLAEGHDWVLLWGIVELASSDLDDDVRAKLRPDVVLTDVQVRNHVSLPGVFLWIATAGLVSHHDLDLRGRIATVKEEPKPTGTVALDRERTIIVPTPAPPVIVPVPGERAAIVPGEREHVAFVDSEAFAESTIDRPLGKVLGDFHEAALRAGLVSIADVPWDKPGESRGEIPPDRLEGVSPSSVHTELVTTEDLARDVAREPHCGAFVPGIVFYVKDGRTNVFYVRPTAKLRELDASGKVGDGKLMSRAAFEEHMVRAQDFERCVQSLLESLRATGPKRS